MPHTPEPDRPLNRSDQSDDLPSPGGDARFDAEMSALQKRRKAEQESRDYLGQHPDGVGPTLGQDFGRPNPGEDLPATPTHDDPPA